MSGKNKSSICKWSKDEFEDRRKTFSDIVLPPKYYCRKCGRVAAKKKWLCKPESLSL